MKDAGRGRGRGGRGAGGLYVLGTERHESRRIDNQLRGRSGRQGDPGESRFYLSLGDELMRRFNGAARRVDHEPVQPAGRRADRGRDGHQGHPQRADPGRAAELRDPQERPQVRRGAQQAAHGHLRRAPPGARRRGHPASRSSTCSATWSTPTSTAPPPRATPRTGTSTSCGRRWARSTRSAWTARSSWTASIDDLTRDTLAEAVLADAREAYARREAEIDAVIGAQGGMRELERQVLLQVMDRKWREHLYEMDYLKEGIGLRAMAQRDPLIEYQREGFDMFAAMLEGIKEETVGHLFNVRVQAAPAAPPPRRRSPTARRRARSSGRSRTRRSPRRPRPHRRPRRRASAPPAYRRGPGAVRAAGMRRPRVIAAATTSALPTVFSGGPRPAVGAAVQRPGRGRGHDDPQPLRRRAPAAGGAGRSSRRAGPEPAVPVRLGPQVQALPRHADGRPPLSRSVGPVSHPPGRVHGLRPQAEIMGEVARSGTWPVAMLSRCWSISAAVAIPAPMSRSRICSTVARSSVVHAGAVIGK